MSLITLSILTLILLILTVAPISRKEVWWIRGLDFPRLQFAIASLILLAIECFVLDFSNNLSWVVIGITILCLLYHGWWILPYTKLFKPEVKRSIEKEDIENSFRLMISNVLESNKNYGGLLKLVDKNKPDILATLETNKWWQEKLEVLEKDFPHTIKCPMENRYGMHIYSKFPLKDTEIRFLIEEDVPSMKAGVILPSGKKVHLYVMHPAPPSPTENEESSERDAELIIIAKESADKSEPVVVSGDLNDVAWSYTTRLFRKISKLLDPRIGRGMFNTFHAEYKFIRWPLDHLFHSKHFLLTEIKKLPAYGSDHFPILVELVLSEENYKNEENLEASEEDEEVAEEKLQKEKQK